MEKQFVLILGAKSAIARALAHRYAKAGFSLYLAARKPEQVEADATDLALRYKVSAEAVAFDALDFDSFPGFWEGLAVKPEVVIWVIGVLFEQKDAEQDVKLALTTIQANFTGAALFLNLVGNEMEKAGKGSIIGISSVAGDRGRASNYFYGSAKAGFSTFLDGLRNRLYKAGVHVVTVKPGFVYTKMTEGMDLPGRLTAKPEQVAKAVFKAWKKKKNTIYTKWMWRWVMWIIRNIPEWQFKKMKL